MRKRFYLVTALSLILVASAPLNASAEALNDSFYSAQEVDENVEIEDFGEIEDEFISDDIPFHLGLQSRLHYLIIIKMEVAANGI